MKTYKTKITLFCDQSKTIAQSKEMQANQTKSF